MKFDNLLSEIEKGSYGELYKDKDIKNLINSNINSNINLKKKHLKNLINKKINSEVTKAQEIYNQNPSLQPGAENRLFYENYFLKKIKLNENYNEIIKFIKENIENIDISTKNKELDVNLSALFCFLYLLIQKIAFTQKSYKSIEKGLKDRLINYDFHTLAAIFYQLLINNNKIFVKLFDYKFKKFINEFINVRIKLKPTKFLILDDEDNIILTKFIIPYFIKLIKKYKNNIWNLFYIINNKFKKIILSKKIIPNSNIQNLYSNVFERLYKKPLGDNVWVVTAHGQLEKRKVFKTKIPIIFESSLYEPTLSNISNHWDDQFFSSIFSLSNGSSLMGNNYKVYRVGDLVPDLRLDFYLKHPPVKGYGKNPTQQSGIIKFKTILNNPNNGKWIVKNSEKARLNYHNKNTFNKSMNGNEYNLLSNIVKELYEKKGDSNPLIIVRACRVIIDEESQNYINKVKNLINTVDNFEFEQLKNENKEKKLLLNPPNLERNISFSATTLKESKPFMNRINLKNILKKTNIKPELRSEIQQIYDTIEAGNSINIDTLSDKVKKLLDRLKKSGGSKFIYIKGFGKRKIRFQKNGKPYVIVKGKKIKI